MLSAARWVASQIEGIAGIRHAAHHRLASTALDGNRLSRQCRLVKDSDPFGDKPVDWNDVALPDEQAIPGFDGVEPDLLKPTVPMAEGCPRHASQERRHRTVGAALGEALQVLPTGVHQGHDDGGKVLPKHERADHGEGGNDVEAYIPAPQAGNDLNEQGAQDRNGRRAPDRPGPLPAPGGTYAEAQQQAECGQDDQDGAEKLVQVLQRWDPRRSGEAKPRRG